MDLIAEELDIAPYPAPDKCSMLTGKVPPGVIVLHKPTGVFAISVLHRHQHENREAAIAQLRTKLVMTVGNQDKVEQL